MLSVVVAEEARVSLLEVEIAWRKFSK